MMGAALLTSRACLRSGAGKLVSAIPSSGLSIFQSALPEAICVVDLNPDKLENLPEDYNEYTAIGAGPGIGKDKETRKLLKTLLAGISKPLVLDADALNIIAEEKWMDQFPANLIITPHFLEFTRLFGHSANDFDRLNRAIDLAGKYGIYIVLKGRHTLVATPGGRGYINTTGNPGMAKGGSGDVLTGLITGLLVQSYSLPDACLAGVFIHGMAGDLAITSVSEHSLLASDIIEQIGPAFIELAS
jgi:ADP-dependent NAD(P)H-hydrate dehydratase / NAD(P)H-hydrate epimerase